MLGCRAIWKRLKTPLSRASLLFTGREYTRLCLWLPLLCLAAAIALPEPAAAQSYAVQIVDNFQCPARPGDPVMPIVQTMPSPNNRDGIFLFVMKVYQAALFTAMAQGYCAMSTVAEGPLMAGLLLAVVIFGLSTLLGMTRMSVREGMITLFKLSLVVTFALNAEIAMRVVFKFFLALSTEMPGWINAMDPSKAIDFDKPDSSFNHFASYFTDTDTVKAAPCAPSLLLFFVSFSAIFPTMGAPLLVMLMTFVMIFVRSVLGFLVALGAVCLLMATAPLFIGFALFRVTYGFFDRWLKSMISYSLQMVVVFFIFWVAISLFDFMKMFSDLEKAFAPPPDSEFSFMLANTSVPVMCTPCQGFKYVNPQDPTQAGGVGFDQFRCDNTTPGQRPTKGVPLFSNYTSTLPQFGGYLLTNVIYLLILLWGIKELLVAAPLIAYQLAGDSSSMNLGGRVGRTGSEQTLDDRYSFNIGGSANGLDQRMDKMTEGMRFAMDAGYRRDIKDARRETDPEYLRGGFFSRFKEGIRSGFEQQGSTLSTREYYQHAEGVAMQQQHLYHTELKVQNLKDQQTNAYTKYSAALQQHHKGEITDDELKDIAEKYEEIDKKLAAEEENAQEAAAEYRRRYAAMMGPEE